jgi:hypothetical protein
MNDKHGNHLDQRIRQTLDTLPDAPPPGSTFDSAKLWERMRPELAAQSVPAQVIVVRKRPVFGWWVAAASLAGLLMGWLWWSGQLVPKQDMASRKSSEKTGVSNGLSAKPNPSKNQPKMVVSPIETRLVTTFPKRKRQQKNRFTVGTNVTKQPDELTGNQPSTADDGPMVSSVETPRMSSAPPNAVSVVITQKPVIASTTKRRFRVVHTNELVAEEESNVVRYRAERFVRLGTGSPSSAGSGSESPTLLIPLNRKSIQ